MSKAKIKTKPKKGKKKLSPQEKVQRAFYREFRSFFRRLDFIQVKVDGTEIVVDGRTGELDDIFVYENVLVLVTKPGGSICWQVGYHVSKQAAYPLDYAVFSILEGNRDIVLRNRIIWSFAHGLHTEVRFSGRHETLLWYTKGDNYFFNLDSVRVLQKYPGKRHYKGPAKGEFSGNPLGKNPGDVWEIPNVKGNHVEKVDHPCQFPVAIVQRAARALCPPSGLVLDPYMGAGSAGVASMVEGRRFVGAELNNGYFKSAAKRLRAAANGKAAFRPIEKPIQQPDPRSGVATIPPHFKVAAE